MASSTFDRSRRSTTVSAVLAAASLLAIAEPARADAPRSNAAVRDAARAKLVDGVDALKRGEHRTALERFQEAYALVPSPKIHYDFGLAYLGLGRSAEALTAFERFLADAKDAPADKRANATAKVAALRPQVGVVTIAVEGAPDGTPVAVDGREVGRTPLVTPVYLDPGAHEIVAHLSGNGARPSQRVDIRAGGHLEVSLRAGGAEVAAVGPASASTVTLLPSAAPVAPASSAPDAVAGSSSMGAGPDEPAADARRIAAISLGAAGLALIGVGVTFGALARNESDSLSDDSVRAAAVGMPTSFDPAKESRGTTYESLQVVGLIAGAVGLTAGIVLYVTNPRRARVEPTAGRASGGANLRIAF